MTPTEELTAQGLASPFRRARSGTVSERLRRRILREVVADNVETVHGYPRGFLARRRRRRALLLRRALVVSAAVAVVALGAGLWLGTLRQADATAAAEPQRIAVQPLKWPDGDRSASALAQDLAEGLATGAGRTLVTDVVPLAVRRVVLDPGHGGRDPGTSLGHGLVEKDLTLDIALRLQRLLVAGGCEALLTRDEDETVSLRERAARANQSGADLFLSIHINWLPARNVRGVETYYLGPTDDPFLKSLAAAENRDSGYSVADYRRLLEGIYADARREESRRLAEGIQRALYETLRPQNPLISTRRVLTAPFVVLVATDMPAVLAEVACMSNDHEARQLALPTYRETIAAALLSGVSRYAESLRQPRLEGEKGTGP